MKPKGYKGRCHIECTAEAGRCPAKLDNVEPSCGYCPHVKIEIIDLEEKVLCVMHPMSELKGEIGETPKTGGYFGTPETEKKKSAGRKYGAHEDKEN